MTVGIQPAVPSKNTSSGNGSRRILAKELLKDLNSLTYSSSISKRVRKKKYLMSMLTDLALTTRAVTLDGDTIEVNDTKEWLDVVKALLMHIDGTASNDTQFNGVNVFKVYAGIDIDKV
jgi:hypothetical protein